MSRIMHEVKGDFWNESMAWVWRLNGAVMLVNGLAVVIFPWFGGHWVIYPFTAVWMAGFATAWCFRQAALAAKP